MSNQRYILGERFWLLREMLTKSEATTVAQGERKRGHKARLEKINRGEYKVWVNHRTMYSVSTIGAEAKGEARRLFILRSKRTTRR